MILLSVAVFFLSILCSSASASNVEVQHDHDAEEAEFEEVIVQATRSGRRLLDGALRIEALSGEEVEEKLLMRPGNISMMLNETGGLRVQVTSPALGSANVRIHGMRGRYTQLLADGLPLYGGQASSLGLLQVPPSDLSQVEIIKGAASALYGGHALGGVINLVSKYPDSEPGGEVILNATTRNGQDISAYGETQLSSPLRTSFLGNISRQSPQDLDGDNWIDMPSYERIALRPRLFYENGGATRAFLTVGGMTENRQGGTIPNGKVPSGDPFPQNQKTRRLDAGMKVSHSLNNRSKIEVRASSMRQDHDHRFGGRLEVDSHQTRLLEFSVVRNSPSITLVGGAAYQVDQYRADMLPAFDYRYRVPALFGQIDYDLSDDIAIAASTRWDSHSQHGSQISPRISLLYRPGNWTLRGSLGRGFYSPTPFVEETEAVGLFALTPLEDLEVEQAQTGSVDLGYSTGSIEAGITFFASKIDGAITPIPTTYNRVRLVNLDNPTQTHGVEGLLRWREEPFSVTASYLFLDATEQLADTEVRRQVPLTPKHSAGLVAMWEKHGQGRIGLEFYYTGEQSLPDNPYREKSKPYLHIGILGEINLRNIRLFLNLENILNIRQTRIDPLLRRTRNPMGDWTVNAWAPLEGFIANAGVRIDL
ncbi:TonB-dependent receptor [Gammaproteobacteria bacterium]|nr:TonB-dependent receptor [Gammaproteobacteria bacterium]